MATKIAIAGVKGRMGRNLIESGLSNKGIEIVGVFDIAEIDQEFLQTAKLPAAIATIEKNHLRQQTLLSILPPQKLYLPLLKAQSLVRPDLLLVRLALKSNISIF